MATSGREPDDRLTPDDPSAWSIESADGRVLGPVWPGSLEDRLYQSGYRFDFFQAVRLLQRMGPSPGLVGHHLKPRDEAVRFRAFQTLGFPASSIQEIRRAEPGSPPILAQNFLGLTGPSGIMPLHYSEMLLQFRGPAGADVPLRDWLDLFNHRFTSFFYRTWEKYRPYPAFERGRAFDAEPDRFTWVMLSLVGLGLNPLRNRLTIAVPGIRAETAPPRISDQTLLYHAGLLSQRPANVACLEQLIQGVFRVSAAVDQFQGQWLRLTDSQQTRLGRDDSSNNELGVSAIAGSRVWDVQGKFRIKLGPLDFERFAALLPIEGLGGIAGRWLALLFRLVRLYVGPELEFDVQLILQGSQVPPCRLDSADPIGSRLGWNTWLLNQASTVDRDDASFTDDFPKDY